ncbi:TNFAIP3-interacting protein 3-like [Xenia sp. Carnegie-2017]|uniref:TNFAIP3-interacting protein 3-like n=1 Tax=Xenia sp. Carnegie-2017 TaxID=2897299 RepID=UPI001F0402A1|nr:TNFAIP3-interacting protein 3-like [Xenia sp. Carnegie-2017]
MDNEIKNEKCSYEDLELKYKQCLNDNEHLAKMMRNLRQENDKLNNESRNQTSRLADERLRLAEGEDKRKQKYNERFTRRGSKIVKGRVNELEERQSPLEDELGRLASALYAQQSVQHNRDENEVEKCEMLKSQILVYKEDFDRERKDREN